MRRLDAKVTVRWMAVSVALIASASCGKHYLNQYQFADKTLALVYIEPPAPELLHGWYNVDVDGNAIQTVVQAGAKVAKEVEARRASARLDSAARRVDVSSRLAQRTLERASRYLGTRMAATSDGADYVLEVHMRRFGIDARSNRTTYLFTRAEAVLLDRKTGREIWSEEVRGSDRLTPYVVGTTSVPSAIFTAATLHTVTVAQFQQALEQLVTYTSNLITNELRENLRDVRASQRESARGGGSPSRITLCCSSRLPSLPLSPAAPALLAGFSGWLLRSLPLQTIRSRGPAPSRRLALARAGSRRTTRRGLDTGRSRRYRPRMPHPFDSIPELAGVATYQSAARVGYSVAENVQHLLRYHWTERRLMATLIAHITSMPVWEVKCAMALHQWQSAEHVEWLRARITEMRSPVPNLDTPPDGGSIAELDQVFDALEQATDPAAVVAAIYTSAYPALADAYRTHIAETNPLVDHPTRRMLRFALQETEDAIAWGRNALPALGSRLSADQVAESREPPAESHRFHPRRDERFHGQYNFEFPPHVVYNLPNVPADERNLALLCKRALEMDVPEMMASFMTERDGQPWEFYRDYSRQLWDEARHAMLGTVALEARGIDWKRDIPLNVSFALRLNLHATPLERQTMLYAIEQSLMPGETGKRFEYETAVAAGDELSAHFHDYDWADEVLHARIGRRMLKRDGISSQQAADRAKEVHEKSWAALDQYRGRDRQENWWPAFVEKALGKPSAVEDRQDLGPINVFSE